MDAVTSQPLGFRRISRFYYPLALSWLFMSIEAPVSLSIISRMPNSKVNTAAFLMLMSMALWIESPVIDLLSTSTTLTKDRQSFGVMTRWALMLMTWCGVVHALIMLTPLYGLITGPHILNLPDEVAHILRVPLITMIPWSPFIGWRRYLQGILIRSGKTRMVGLGTFVRISTMATVGGSLYLWGGFTGVQTTAISLICSVGSEALFAHIVSRSVIRNLPNTEANPPLQLPRLAQFHLPLTVTTMLTLSIGPLVSAALDRSADNILQLAAWQVTSTIVWMHRTVVFALPEVVITLYDGAPTERKLRHFCLMIGTVSSGLLAFLWLTHLDYQFNAHVLGTAIDTANLAHVAIGFSLFLPFIGALQSYARGMLTVHHRTMPRLTAVIVGTAVLIVGLITGVVQHWQGVQTAAIALTRALVAELAVLTWSNRASTRGPVTARS